MIIMKFILTAAFAVVLNTAGWAETKGSTTPSCAKMVHAELLKVKASGDLIQIKIVHDLLKKIMEEPPYKWTYCGGPWSAREIACVNQGGLPHWPQPDSSSQQWDLVEGRMTSICNKRS